MSDESKESPENVSKNAFLSRIFRMQSTDMSTSIDPISKTKNVLVDSDNRMSSILRNGHVHVGTKHEKNATLIDNATQKNNTNISNNDNIQKGEEGGLQVPESDQDTSSSENVDTFSEHEDPFIYDNTRRVESFLNDNSDLNEEDPLLVQSMPKLGQVSSNEDDRDNETLKGFKNPLSNDNLGSGSQQNSLPKSTFLTNSDDFIVGSSTLDTTHQANESESSSLNKSSMGESFPAEYTGLQTSLLFQRILKHNFNDNTKKENGAQLFTSSNDANKSPQNKGFSFENLYNKRNQSSSFAFDLERNTGPEKTHENSNNGQSPKTFLHNSFININKPNKNNFNQSKKNHNNSLLKNIKVLNSTPRNRLNKISPKETALWKWANVENLDIFLQDVYKYYLGNGFYCIILQKVLNIATLIFVVFISTFMGYCVDYSLIPKSHTLSDVKIEQCYAKNVTGLTRVFILIFYGFIVLKLIQLYFDVINLKEIQKFYKYLLNINDKELETISWQKIIEQLISLKDQNALTANVTEVKAKNRIDAHDVANRIMRKENYFIALINSDIINLSLPLPLCSGNMLTKTIEWNLNLCIFGFIFNEKGFLKHNILKFNERDQLSEELQKRFILAGVLNIIIAPFLVCYFVLLYFFRYFNEFKTSPGNIGTRQYTPYAEWKFREYNELYHIFQKRLGLSTDVADKYIQQFPNEASNIVMRFISLVSGSFVAILVLLTILDPENFFNFELTHDKTALFYITIFGGIWTGCHNLVSNQYRVFDPEEMIKSVATYTHYLPEEWEDKYHTEEIKQEFCTLYDLKILILLRELASLILTPFILWFSLPKCSNDIIDFFRNNSVYIDGLGYVYKYAMFDIQNTSNNNNNGVSNKSNTGTSQKTNNGNQDLLPEAVDFEDEEEKMAKEKMMRSYIYFIDDYENKDNMVGKTQIPHNKYNIDEISGNKNLATNYSWRKQFQPGQKPELFLINRKYDSNGISNLDTKISDNSKAGNLDLGESFINSKLLRRQQSSKLSQSGSSGKKHGVFALVKEYYKDIDIGR